MKKPPRTLVLAVGAFSACPIPLGAVEKANDIIAAKVRAQGYACLAPTQARRESGASRPDGAVWLLECANARYRVRLVPNMAANIELAPAAPAGDRGQ